MARASRRRSTDLDLARSAQALAIRKKLNLSQDDFAAEFGFTINQIRDWEQGRTRPLGGLRAYLMLIKSDPQAVLRLLRNSTAKKRAAKAA